MVDEISLTMLGTGSPRPDLERSGPSQALHIYDQTMLIDCGEGTTTQLLRAGIKPEEITVLFFTHLHSDHFLGYGQFLLGGWGRGRRELTVIGPKGLRRYHDTIINMYQDDIAYRTSLGRPENGILDVNIIEIDGPGELQQIIPAKVTAKEMVHNVLTYGYRFEIGNRVVVISGDTAPTPNIIKLAKDADILVQDACLAKTGVYRDTESSELKKIWDSLQKEHCTPRQAGEIAQEANAKKLVMTHFLPDIIPTEVLNEATEVYDGEVVVAEDLMKIHV